MYAITVYTSDNHRALIATVDDYHEAIAIATGVRATRHGNGATGGRVIVSDTDIPRAMWRMWDDGTAETL